MELLQKIVYSLVSGISSILPISARGHQVLILRLFGQDGRDPVLDLAVHLGVILTLVVCCRRFMGGLLRELRISKRYKRTRFRQGSGAFSYELRLLRTAMVPTLLALLLTGAGANMEKRPILVCVFFVIYGSILYICDHIRQGNKDSQSMSALDSVFIGLSAVLSVIPGFSRTGVQLCAAISRGADRQRALEWILILALPATVLLLIFDLIAIITASIGAISFTTVIGFLCAFTSSFTGGCMGVILMRFLIVRGNLSSFGYYCWGAALFSFILYLIV